MANQFTIYNIHDVINILAGNSKKSHEEFIELFSSKPLVYDKNSDEYSQKLEHEFIDRLSNRLNLTHTSTIKPAKAFDASWNQYKGDVALLDLQIYFDLKNATLSEGKLRGNYPTYFTGCIKKDSLKTFSDINHFYIGFNKTCTKITVIDARALHDYVVTSGYNYTKVDGTDLVILNDIPRGYIWDFI